MLAAALMLPASAAAAPAPYATAPAAMRGAIRDAVARQAPGAAPGRIVLGCETPALQGEATVCEGAFTLRARPGAPRAVYALTARSRVVRQDAATLVATLDARRTTTPRRGVPKRLTARRALTRAPTPAERTIHADLLLERGRGFSDLRASRDRWLAFAAPFGFRQAVDEGPETVRGALDHDFTLPPGAHCVVRVEAQARLTAAPPREEPAGRLLLDPNDDDGGKGESNPKILSRVGGPDGSVTYTILDPSPGEHPGAVIVAPAPAGAGPAGLPWLAIVARAGIHDFNRFGAPGPDGYPLLEPLPAQERACIAAAGRVAAAAVPRIVATATVTARPPRAP